MLAGTAHGWQLIFGSLTCFYIAAAFAKTAFSLSLFRLSISKTLRLVLGFLVGIMWAFALTMSVVTHLRICQTEAEAVGLDGVCLPMNHVVWIHTANAAVVSAEDLVLAYLPWRILKTVAIPKREKWAVGMSLSLVGVSPIISVVK